MSDPREHKLRWYQYKLSSLFILTALVAIACSWYATEMQNAAKRRAVIAQIEKLGGSVKYYDASDPNTGEPLRWFSWLRKLHGDEHLGNAIAVVFSGTRITDAGLVHLKGLTKLELLYLVDTQITDAGLVNLKGLTKLELLFLFDTQITDAGLVNLKDLTKLECLYLFASQITDAGLAHLRDLTNLEELGLDQTQVTNKGVTKLQEALPNCSITHSLP